MAARGTLLDVDIDALSAVLRAQSGVVSRRQVLAAGGGDHDTARFIRRRHLTRVHVGVYVDHTGPLSDRQRAWAAVLAHWPAVLSGESSLFAHGVRGVRLPAQVEVAISCERRVDTIPSVVARRVRDLSSVALWSLSPPRTRLEHAVLVVASRATRDDAAVAVIADACQSRRTTPARLGATLSGMPRLRRRAFLGEVIGDAASGALSALERRYLRDVERAHGLPRASRQGVVREDGGVRYRDVEHLPWHVLVELDGRLGHEWAAETWDDMDRDVSATVSGRITLRAGWRQVLDPCRLASAVAAVLRARGWGGELGACGPDCVAVDRGGSRAPGAEDPPSLAG